MWILPFKNNDFLWNHRNNDFEIDINNEKTISIDYHFALWKNAICLSEKYWKDISYFSLWWKYIDISKSKKHYKEHIYELFLSQHLFEKDKTNFDIQKQINYDNLINALKNNTHFSIFKTLTPFINKNISRVSNTFAYDVYNHIAMWLWWDNYFSLQYSENEILVWDFSSDKYYFSCIKQINDDIFQNILQETSQNNKKDFFEEMWWLSYIHLVWSLEKSLFEKYKEDILQWKQLNVDEKDKLEGVKMKALVLNIFDKEQYLIDIWYVLPFWYLFKTGTTEINFNFIFNKEAKKMNNFTTLEQNLQNISFLFIPSLTNTSSDAKIKDKKDKTLLNQFNAFNKNYFNIKLMMFYFPNKTHNKLYCLINKDSKELHQIFPIKIINSFKDLNTYLLYPSLFKILWYETLLYHTTHKWKYFNILWIDKNNQLILFLYKINNFNDKWIRTVGALYFQDNLSHYFQITPYLFFELNLFKSNKTNDKKLILNTKNDKYYTYDFLAFKLMASVYNELFFSLWINHLNQVVKYTQLKTNTYSFKENYSKDLKKYENLFFEKSHLFNFLKTNPKSFFKEKQRSDAIDVNSNTILYFDKSFEWRKSSLLFASPYLTGIFSPKYIKPTILEYEVWEVSQDNTKNTIYPEYLVNQKYKKWVLNLVKI